MTMYEGGYITNVECTDCGESFPVFTFEADNDMVTAGCIALTGIEEKDIVLTTMAADETTEVVKQRIGHGYKVAKIEYQVPRSQPATGSFQDFLKIYKAPVPAYKCIFCGGKTIAGMREEKEEFLKHGTIEVRDAL
jgi:hypothetical protein